MRAWLPTLPMRALPLPCGSPGTMNETGLRSGMGISANIELGQQHFAAGLRVIGDLKNCDQFVGNFHRVLKLNLLPWPAAVVANAVGYTPFQRLAGLCTAHDDGVVTFKALLERFVVTPA